MDRFSIRGQERNDPARVIYVLKNRLVDSITTRVQAEVSGLYIWNDSEANTFSANLVENPHQPMTYILPSFANPICVPLNVVPHVKVSARRSSFQTLSFLAPHVDVFVIADEVGLPDTWIAILNIVAPPLQGHPADADPTREIEFWITPVVCPDVEQ